VPRAIALAIVGEQPPLGRLALVDRVGVRAAEDGGDELTIAEDCGNIYTLKVRNVFKFLFDIVKVRRTLTSTAKWIAAGHVARCILAAEHAVRT
jgi:hypothetical protein